MHDHPSAEDRGPESMPASRRDRRTRVAPSVRQQQQRARLARAMEHVTAVDGEAFPAFMERVAKAADGPHREARKTRRKAQRQARRGNR